MSSRHTLAEIKETVGLMESRLESGQGGESDAMCRLSLPMARSLLALLKREQKELVTRQVQAAKAIEARDVWRVAARGLLRRLTEACDHADEHVHDNDPERGMGRYAATPQLTTAKIRDLLCPAPRRAWCSYCGALVRAHSSNERVLECDCGRVAVPEDLRLEHQAFEALRSLADNKEQ